MTLAAVEEASRGAASAEADAIRGAARERARQVVEEARAEAAALIERRRAAAERLAELEEQETLAAARAQARGKVLAAQRSVLGEARAAAHDAARQLIGDPRYDSLIERAGADARERLSGAGPVELTPAPGGGVLATAGGRGLDYSLSAQVERCLQSLGSELEQLWR